MSPSIDRPDLSETEWQFIQGLRALPDQALRARVQGSLKELLYFFQNPKCQGIGVEGFPCGDPRSSCEDCHQIWEALDKVAERAKKG
jgi:hypothetical protein